jgi:hypothetical protein
MRRSGTLAVAGLILVSWVAHAQTGPSVAGLWVLPTQFKDNGEVLVQNDFANEGKGFLAAFRKRAPALSSPAILEGPDVTKQNVLGKMQQILKSLTVPGSIFVFYYAGHGIRPSQNTYLAMQGCEVGDDVDIANDDAMIMLEKIMDIQAKYQGVYFIGYIDACYSGNETFPQNRYLWSQQLGPRGFLLCSAGSDRKSYIPKFTKALTEVFEHDALFNSVRTPSDLLQQTLKSTNFPPEQVPHLIPRACNLQITYPLPGLCFYCIDFGGIINTPVTVNIITADGRFVNLSFNEPQLDAPPSYIGSITFPVQQLSNVTIIVNFDSNHQQKLNVDLSGRTFGSASLSDYAIPHRESLSSQNPKSRLAAAAANFRSVVERAKTFGLSDSDLTDLCTPLFASTFGKLDPRKSQGLISEQLTFLAANAPSSPDVAAIRVLAGIDTPAGGPGGFAVLDKAIATGIPVTQQLATAYAKHIEANVALLKNNTNAAWIRPGELTEKFVEASETVKASKSVEAGKVLTGSLHAAAEPENRILSKHDYKQAREAVTSATAEARAVTTSSGHY